MSAILTARGLFTFKDSSHGHWRQEILKIQQTINPAAFNIYEVKINLGRTAITYTGSEAPHSKLTIHYVPFCRKSKSHHPGG